jgi:hypothetical protein
MDESKLHTARSRKDVYKLFSYSADDQVDHREQIIMFTKTKAAMDQQIDKLTTDGKYADAAVLRDAMKKIRGEFEELQREKNKAMADIQQKQMVGATFLINKNMEQAWEARREEIERECEAKRQALEKTKQCERDALERELERMPVPRIKYSKALIELQYQEAGLQRSKLFEEAKNVRVKVNQLEKKETAEHERKFQAMKERKIADLVQKHDSDSKRLEKKLRDAMLSYERDKGKDLKVAQVRLNNHQSEMAHAHTRDAQALERPELSLEAVKRNNGKKVSNTAQRGQQLLESVTRKRLEVPSLCEIHVFEDEK